MIKIHSKKGHHWFTVCGRNGHVFATSETYTRRSSCVKAAEDLRRLMMNGTVFIQRDYKVTGKNKTVIRSYPEDKFFEG